MRKGSFIYLTILTLMFSACGLITKSHKTPQKSLQPPDVGYKGSDEVLFYYTEAIKFKTLGQREKSLHRLHKAIELDSMHMPSLYQLAYIYAPTEPQKALIYSQRAMALDSSNVWIKSQLGQLLITSRSYDKAIDIYQDLVEELPNETTNYRILAALHIQNNNSHTAINILDSAENKLGHIEVLSKLKIHAFKNLRLHDKAIIETKELIATHPDDYQYYLTLAELYAETREDSLAVVNYKKALNTDPEAIDILLSMSSYYKGVGDDQQLLATIKKLFISGKLGAYEMVNIYDKTTSNRDFYRKNFIQIKDLGLTLIIKYPNNEAIVKLYTNNLIYQGDLDEALKIYKELTKRDSVPLTYFITIMEMETYKKNIDSVELYSSKALALYPENIGLMLRRGAIFGHLKSYDKASDEYKSALKHATNDSIRSSIEGSIGDILYESGDSKRAYKQYRKALALFPKNTLVLNNYAYFLSEDNEDLELALSMAKQVMELHPRNATYLDTYGWILHKLGRSAEAKKVIQQAISLDSRNSSEILLHYGDIYHSLGDNFMAKIYWEKALKAGHDKLEINKRLETQDK